MYFVKCSFAEKIFANKEIVKMYTLNLHIYASAAGSTPVFADKLFSKTSRFNQALKGGVKTMKMRDVRIIQLGYISESGVTA